ncbi:hypothetical protein KC722_02360 [Candidatus Kaiserbacteria bacterium]|nr:hypothetical protein [Candidatus Kaiserbacteria bacterium]
MRLSLNLTLLIFSSFFIPSAVSAEETCGDIRKLDGDTVTISDCDNPFAADYTGVPFNFSIQGQELENDVTIIIDEESTDDYSYDERSFSSYTIRLFKHEEGNFEEVDFEPIEPEYPNTDETIAKAEAYFPEGEDITAILEAISSGDNDALTESEEDMLYDFYDYLDGLYSDWSLPAVSIGTYTMVFEEMVLCVSYESGGWWQQIKEFFVPVAYAMYCTGEPNTYAVTFTISNAPPEPEIDPLLLEYAPILYFHEGEVYFPMDVETFIEDSALWSKEGIGDTLEIDDDNLTVENFELYIAHNDTTDHYLAYSDPENAKSINLDRAKEKYDDAVNGGRATTTVYAYIMEDDYEDDLGFEHDFIVLQYWFFYAMNNWGEVGGRNNHEGDWESVFVFLDKTSKEPLFVAYSAHVNDGDPDIYALQYDSVRREWADVEREGQKAISYVAQGSHANYVSNQNGTHNVFGKNDQTSLNGTHVDDYEVEDIDTSSLFDYEGTWGADGDNLLGGDNGPQGPRHIDLTGQVRFEEPIEWAGIDKVTSVTLEDEEDTFDFTTQGILLQFETPLSEGEELSSGRFDEFINFGSNIFDINLLPQYWNLGTSLPNGSFSVSITLSYLTEQLEALGISEDLLSAFYYNPATNLWEPVATQVDTENKTVTFNTNHFSIYSLGELAVEETEETSTTTAEETEASEKKSLSSARYSLEPTPQVLGATTGTELEEARALIDEFESLKQQYLDGQITQIEFWSEVVIILNKLKLLF